MKAVILAGGFGSWINGGVFVLEPEALDYIDSDLENREQTPVKRLASAGQLGAFRYEGFDTQWIPCATSMYSKSSGVLERLRGRCGTNNHHNRPKR